MAASTSPMTAPPPGIISTPRRSASFTTWPSTRASHTGPTAAFRTTAVGAVHRLVLAQEEAEYRFNWNTPFILSRHNSHLFYSAGNHVFRSLKKGDDLHVLSPEITRTKRGSGTALSESPVTPEVLWAGTDDGYLWVSRDGGVKWTNVTSKVGLLGPRWVASIEAARTAPGRAYVVFD